MRLPLLATCVIVLCLALADTAAYAQQSQDDQVEAPPQAATEEVEPLAVDPRWYEVQQQLEYATAGSFLVTAGLGVVAYLNQPTLTGEGLCIEGDPIFGTQYGCDGLSTLHGIAGASTAVLYVGTGVMDLTLPDPPEQAEGGTFSDVVTGVHIGGMLVLPLLGILANEPQTLGIYDPQSQRDFSETTRTIHASIAVLTAGAYFTSLFID